MDNRSTVQILQWCAVGLVSLLTGQLQAALVSETDATFGANRVTLDTDTGLKWLDIDLTTNLSYNFVITQFGPGSAFEGYRFASADEVQGLFSNAGIPVVPGNDPSNTAPISDLIDLIGGTTVIGDFRAANGSTADVNSFGSQIFHEIAHDGGTFGSVITNGSWPGSNFAPNRGHWLVQASAVPEPSTFAALVVMTTGLVSRRKLRC